MRILIDGDACPVIGITEEIAGQENLELIIFTDIDHQIKTGAKLLVVDSGYQSVDMALYNYCRENDLVITQDYGLASLVLSKGALAVNQSGLQFKEENIDYLLMRRHVHAKMRRAGLRHTTAAKRTEEDDGNFRQALLEMISNRSHYS